MTTPKPPAHLSKHGKALWQRMLQAFELDDEPALVALRHLCEADDRARSCRVIIEREGTTVLDRFEQTKAHPLLSAERDARSQVIACLKLLNIDPDTAPVAHPPGKPGPKAARR